MPTRNDLGGRGRATVGSGPSEALAALTALVLIALIVGVGFVLFSHRSHAKAVELLVAADVTGSVHKSDRQSYFGVLDETVDTAMPHSSLVKMWSFDVNAHKFADVVPKKAEDLWPDEDAIIALKTNTFGTYPGVALNEMDSSAELARNSGKNIAIMILTDGEDQDHTSTEVALRKIAALPNVKAVWFVGTTAENGFRSQLERRMTPILGDRLVVTSKNDAQQGMDRFHFLIEH